MTDQYNTQEYKFSQTLYYFTVPIRISIKTIKRRKNKLLNKLPLLNNSIYSIQGYQNTSGCIQCGIPIEPITSKERLKKSLLDFASRRRRTHFVTLNTHVGFSDKQARQKLERWRVEMMRRLHGQRFYNLPDSDLFEYIASLEHTFGGHPHFHLICSIPDAVIDKFTRHAESRWNEIVPSGTFHIQPITQNAESLPTLVNYVFKNLNINSAEPFIDSRLSQRTPKNAH